MALSSNQLEAFSAIAKHLSFSRAAEALHVTQSALSQRIQNLEEDIGTTLFLRDRSGVRLTETGQALLRYVQMKETLEDEFLASLKASASNELGGVIRIGGFSSITRSVVVPALASLLRGNPSLKLEVMTREIHDLPDLLQRGEVDYVVLDRKWEKADIASLPLGEEENVLVESKSQNGNMNHFLDHDERDPTTENFLKLQTKESLQGLLPKARTIGSALNRRYLDDVYGLMDGVKLGLGRAVLPKHLIEKDADLQIRKGLKPLKVPVVLHFYERPYYSKLHEAVVSALAKNGPALLSGSSRGKSKP